MNDPKPVPAYGAPPLARQRLAALFFVGVLLWFSPLISLFDRPLSWYGIPLLYLYLFGTWILLIVAMAWILGGRGN